MAPNSFLPKFIRAQNLINHDYLLSIGRSIQSYIQSDTPLYLEVGAYDGVFQSNTLPLNKVLGWSGVLIEPVKEQYEKCKINRTQDVVVNFALSSIEGSDKEISINIAGPMSQVIDNQISFKKSFKYLKRFVKNKLYKIELMQTIATISTVKLLENLKVNHIHFASIDVEGFELEVLKGMDLAKMNTLALLIEVRPHNTMPIIDLLVAQNFVLVDSLARFNHIDNPGWDGSHQDYLFLRQDFVRYLAS